MTFMNEKERLIYEKQKLYEENLKLKEEKKKLLEMLKMTNKIMDDFTDTRAENLQKRLKKYFRK